MSTSHALIDLVEEISTSLDKKKYTLGVFIDLKKAFDTVNHSVLIEKLNHYGVRGVAENWIKSYLSGRNQFVKLGECSSDVIQISCGVPRGSVLGPKLFILYINDICNVSKLLKFILFADDTNILYSDSNIHNLISIINHEIDKLYTWFSVNKLSLNASKTNYMILGKRKINCDVDIKINNNQIARVNKTTFLGIMIDEQLNWKEQIHQVQTGLSRITGVMYRARNVLGTANLLTLYHSLLLPIMGYCCEIWGNACVTNLHCITVLQKKAIRLVFGVSRLDHTSMLFYRCRVLRFKDLVQLKMCSILYKVYYNMPVPANVNCLFIKHTHLRRSRLQRQYVLQSIGTNIKARCLSVLCVKCWNLLTASTTMTPTYYAFINKLKTHMLDQYL